MPTARKKLARGQRRNTKYWGTPKSRKTKTNDVVVDPSNEYTQPSTFNIINDEANRTERCLVIPTRSGSEAIPNGSFTLMNEEKECGDVDYRQQELEIVEDTTFSSTPADTGDIVNSSTILSATCNLSSVGNDHCYVDSSATPNLDSSLNVDISATSPYDIFTNLKDQLRTMNLEPFTFKNNDEQIQLLEFYNSDDGMSCSVKRCITIDKVLNIKIFVHRVEVSCDHDFWTGLPAKYESVKDIRKLCDKLTKYSICTGNFDDEYHNLVPIGSGISSKEDGSLQGYREGNFGVSGNVTYTSTIRHVSCQLLVLDGTGRCGPCKKVRSLLYMRNYRKEKKEQSKPNDPVNYMSYTKKHCDMSREELILKLTQQKHKISEMDKEIGKLKRTFQRDIVTKGIKLNPLQSLEMQDTLSSCTAEMEKSYPNSNSFQRLFWNEQFKFLNAKSPSGMRWHPTIIRWCLYIRQRSQSAYDVIRESGFINLPSSRTLFDYSHYIRSANGFQPEVFDLLKNESEKKGMYEEENPWKRYVGLLFDEIRIKSDLVYDKHSGELIGYCDLDKVGNQIMEFENAVKNDSESNSEIAKYLLVLMVRGITTRLRFPLASFATNSISADFIYPIVWKAIRNLELGEAELKVLFVTCDGASANRRFFNMHGNGNEFIHSTVNPYADDERHVYFISDVPHLLKTARNCFSNSYWNKKSRKMWNNGKDISWQHIVHLFEDHCEMSLYTPCPKLKRAHINMTAFSCMKVNLAAQVLSSTVANALETMYGDNTSETVNFIRKMNKFFDCLNVRHIYEGRNKRNPDLNPYNNINDERLDWLQNDFLRYFDDWKRSVNNRPGNFSKSEKNQMCLSEQTLTGLKISVKSIVSCVEFMLDAGASFILTHAFNQDPLEQQFGLYRNKGGDNNNPTVYEARNVMNQMRTVGAQALMPKRGNITREAEDQNIDNHPLPKRRRTK